MPEMKIVIATQNESCVEAMKKFCKNNPEYTGRIILEKADRFYNYDVEIGKFRRKTFNNRMKWNKVL